ncbi:MAG: HTH domain-containing protein [Clostridiales bacterium]|nr:HTH domain-containing protein [Clostridiales bacterium]
MKVEENIILNKLFDTYGLLLSSGQQDIMSSYLQNDLTVSEIAENLSVSRQAVMDSVNKAEKKLFDLEKKLGLLKKIESLEEENKLLKQKLSKNKEL